VVPGQVEQDREPGRAFHEGADRGPVAADDEVALLTILRWVISGLS
jgi:hypothetical protein